MSKKNLLVVYENKKGFLKKTTIDLTCGDCWHLNLKLASDTRIVFAEPRNLTTERKRWLPFQVFYAFDMLQ